MALNIHVSTYMDILLSAPYSPLDPHLGMQIFLKTHSLKSLLRVYCSSVFWKYRSDIKHFDNLKTNESVDLVLRWKIKVLSLYEYSPADINTAR